MHTVEFTTTYVEGALKGLPIHGQKVSSVDKASADETYFFYSTREHTGELIKAAVTGHRYRVSNVRRVS